MGFGPEPVLMVGVIVVRDDGRVLVHRSDNWGGRYTFPGSRVLYGEAVEDAVIRTAQEETGVGVVDPELILVMEMLNDPENTAKGSHLLGLGYVSAATTPAPTKSAGTVPFEWVTPEEAEKLDLATWARKALEKYVSGNTRLQFGSRVVHDQKDAIDKSPDSDSS
ncbi:MAG: NUDIX domain-containing protein [Nitrososphaerota archaeon]|jgi:ADP-ribose pyrophosphatase YjhB (NUDIX family)|nr:NUDIX domain-containing protein [Nitrososphaerota archaeon]MDG6948971.1 NUDIX domain-containing protein [Nitrososphaerota archaeon]